MQRDRAPTGAGVHLAPFAFSAVAFYARRGPLGPPDIGYLPPMDPRTLCLTLGFLAGCGGDVAASETGRVAACIELDLDPQICAPLFPPTFDRLYEELFTGLDGQSGCAAGGSVCHADAEASGAGGGMVFSGDRDAVHASVSMFIEAGDPSCGPLSVRVHTDDASIRMPPGDEGLADGARCALAQWIEAGAQR